MKKRTMMAAGTTSLIVMLGVTAVIGTTMSVPADFPLASHSEHSSLVPVDGEHDHSPAATASPTYLPPSDAAGTETGVVQLSAVTAPGQLSDKQVLGDSGGKKPGKAVPSAPAGKQTDVPASTKAPGKQSERPAPGGPAGAPGQAVRVTPLPDVASVGKQPGKGKPQSLGEALAKPHGVAAGGVSPAGAGVNKGATKQAPGLQLRSLSRGEQDAGVNDAARTGGCALGYGDGRSCLPVSPPSAAQHAGHGKKVRWTCEELLTLFPEGIPLQVRGNDPLRLDEDDNGIACA